MKVNLFQQASYRFLPDGFEDRGVSSVVSTPYELVDPGRVEVRDECGHIPQLEPPEQTLALVGSFLA